MAAGDMGAQAKEDIRRWNCTRCGGNISDFQVVDVIYDKEWDLLAYVGYLPLLDAKTVVFRGTDSHDIGNWIQDLKAWRTDLAVPFQDAPKDVLVHAGFLNAYNNSALRANVTAAVCRLRSSKPEGPLHIIGHSLGAAFATLAALDLRYRMNLSRHDVAVVTFGSPRVGNHPFVRYFVERIASRWRLTHNRDIVPSLPPHFLGFWHVPREVWEVEYWAAAPAPPPRCPPPLPPQPDGTASAPLSWLPQLLQWLWRQLRRAANAFHWPWPWPPEPGPGPQPKHWHRMLRVCDGTGEDPECHSSVCAWGGCTSIADHTSYLGLPLYHNDQEC